MMLKLRVRKIFIFIGFFTVLFLIYQAAYSESSELNLKDTNFINNEESPLELKYKDKFANGLYSQLQQTQNVPNYSLDKSVETSLEGQSTRNKVLPLFGGEKIVHLDLKGAAFKVSYYKSLFPVLKTLGATGLLMEYEDMFPYSNANIPAGNAYSRSDIKLILNLAVENKLEVIPLIQTFGHLEFVLKLEEFESLREQPRYPQVICPSRNGTSQLLKNMIDDIIALHPASKYIHIGCDEVYNLGECNQCLDTMLKNNWTKQQLFLSHIQMVAGYINKKYPNVKPLTWDDEFRKISLQELISSNVGSLVEPVVWKYTPTIDTYLPSEIWEKYSAVFGSVWIASAFKGATGPDKFTTDISYHLENHRAWMKLVATYSKTVTFKGIMITGWQRYDHFAVLCELLPVGLPSLAVNLAYISQNDIDMQKVPQSVLDTLKCGPGLLHPKMGAHCSFPGSDIYEKANQLDVLLDQIGQMQETGEAKGWLTDYNIQIDFSNPAHVEGATNDLDRYKMELMYLKQDISRMMGEVFFPDTVNEWIYTFIIPVQKRLEALWDAKEKLLAKRVWPRRPIQIDSNKL